MRTRHPDVHTLPSHGLSAWRNAALPHWSVSRATHAAVMIDVKDGSAVIYPFRSLPVIGCPTASCLLWNSIEGRHGERLPLVDREIGWVDPLLPNDLHNGNQSKVSASRSVTRVADVVGTRSVEVNMAPQSHKVFAVLRRDTELRIIHRFMWLCSKSRTGTILWQLGIDIEDQN